MNTSKILFSGYIQLLLFLSIFSKLQKDIISIKLIDEEITLISQDDSYYQIIPESILNKSIKILVRENIENENYINHVISYYKDPEFNDRKQLAQSLTGTTYMWLNENQIKDKFYLSVECAKTPCNYTINIIPKEYPELNLGEQYTYYIKEDNQNYRFFINLNLTSVNISTENNRIFIFARGSKYLNAVLNDTEPTYKKEGNIAYNINIKEKKEYKYYFDISGKSGALITIGVLLYGGELENTLENDILENGIEYSGLLLKGIIEKNCYKIPKDKDLEINVDGYEKNYDAYSIIDNETNIYTLKCIIFRKNPENIVELNEYFYTIQFIYNFTDDGQGMNKYPQILPDISYFRYFDGGAIMVINQLEPEDNYKYLSFYADIIGEGKIYSHICETFPLCQIDSDVITKHSKSLQDFDGMFSYSFKKEEIGNNISPISKTQHLFFVLCEEDSLYGQCMIRFFSYSNNSKIPFPSKMIIYERKDDEN